MMMMPGGAIEIQIVGNLDDRIGRQRDLLARAVVAAGRHHAVADLQLGDAGADALDHARDFGRRRKRKRRLDLVFALDHQEVEEIQRRRLDRDHGLVRPRPPDRALRSARDRRDRNIASREWLSWTHLIFGRTIRCFMPDLKPGYNPFGNPGLVPTRHPAMTEGHASKGIERCLKKACWRESGYWSPAAAPGLVLRWDAASSSSAPN